MSPPLTAKGYGKCLQGYYKPTNPKKYGGDATRIIYRSGYELSFMQRCDSDPNILLWSSEEIVIPYISPLDNPRDRKIRRYYPDFLIQTKQHDGKKKTFVVEIKPYKETIPVVINTRRKKKTMLKEAKTYSVNQAKWAAARQWCADRKIEFIIITEKELYGS
jgi:hypothetical protein